MLTCGKSLQVCERDGITYENKYFKVMMPESWSVLNRIKGVFLQR